MVVSTLTSFVLSTTLSVLLFSGMKMFNQFFTMTPFLTIMGGFLGSFIFIFSLTAINNLETVLLGRNEESKLFPEVFLSLIFAMLACALIHGVCVTTCFFFSSLALYHLNNISQKKYKSKNYSNVQNLTKIKSKHGIKKRK